MPDRMKVVILCRDRPLYLWASLDSLYRHTRTPVDVVLIDNNSQDPLVANVIEAFRRRGMFSEVVMSPRNDPHIVADTLNRLGPSLGPFFAYVEGDVVIEASQRCWVATMLELMQSRPRLAMLGSQIDRSDFVDPEWAAAQLDYPPQAVGGIVKSASPERNSFTPPGTVADPHNPPGRLMMLRRTAIEEVGMANDATLYEKLREKGWEGAITGDVIHRHLSLLNIFDYPDYDVRARNEFWKRFSSRDRSGG